ncbi:tail fiber domain-containing protein [Fulvivirga sediminis]|uniref:Tail fiber domain-containing protein n=1 Tax=Fulvivirga sediminis TaxID=2803949 RepID=A0A937FA94_9BACT|nr:tail fiber domain-containing protein [Fulvivirga sediminis]MBL3657862.1 tail fiber domain-containing protein [Fulvivirga sediminis]
MKKLLLTLFLAMASSILFAQFSVNSSGDCNIPLNRDLYIGNFGDSGYRMRLTTLSSYTIFDYNPSLYFRSNTSSGSYPTRVLFTSSGLVGINNSSPSYRLDVGGDVRAMSFITTSDIRLKKNVEPLKNSLSKLLQLESIGYQYNSDIKVARMTPEGTEQESVVPEEGNRNRIGFSAQQLQKIFPELVYEDENGYLGVDYTSLIPVLVESIKEQQVVIEKLLKEVNK